MMHSIAYIYYDYHYNMHSIFIMISCLQIQYKSVAEINYILAVFH